MSAPDTVASGFVSKLREAIRYDGAFWRKAAYFGATRMPEWFRRGSPPLIGALFYTLLSQKRRTVFANLQQLLGRSSHRTTLELFVRYAECLTDSLEMHGRSDRAMDVRVLHPERFLEARQLKRGMIVLTAHTGSWEVAAQGTSTFKGTRTTMVMAREQVQASVDFMDPLRRQGVTDVVYAEGDDPSTGLTLLSRLRNNEIIAIQIDRAPRSGRCVTVPFGSATLRMPEGPFRLAQVSGAPLIPVFTWRHGHRAHTLDIGPLHLLTRRAPPDELRGVASQIAQHLHRFVSAHPDQWFHFEPLEHNDVPRS